MFLANETNNYVEEIARIKGEKADVFYFYKRYWYPRSSYLLTNHRGKLPQYIWIPKVPKIGNLLNNFFVSSETPLLY